MTLVLPPAPPEYDARDQAEFRRAIRAADAATQKTNADIIIQGRRLVLVAPDGGLWSVVVDNAGNLDTEAL